VEAVAVVVVAINLQRISTMKTSPCLVLSITLILLGSGCQHVATPPLSLQQQFYKSLKAANPEEEAALRGAQYHNLIGRFDLALQELSKAAASDPHNVRLLNAMGNCYDNLGQYARAQEMYESILANNADNFPARNNLGYSCYLSGDYSRAEKIFQEILAKNPEDTMARNNLGLLWCRQGKESAALGLWQKTEGQIPAREKLAQVLASLGKSGNRLPNCVPKNDFSKSSTAPQDRAGRVEKESVETASTRPDTNNAMSQLSRSRSTAEESPASSKLTSNLVNLNGKNLPKPQVKVEEVKMIVQPATYSQTTAEETVAKAKTPGPPIPPVRDEEYGFGVNSRTKPKEFVLDNDLLEDDDEETPSPQPYYPRPRQLRRYPQPKIVTYTPPPKESQSLKKCLSQECIYQNQNAPGRQESVF
jgi:tetratricopeptide (TPR) repeat protein